MGTCIRASGQRLGGGSATVLRLGPDLIIMVTEKNARLGPEDLQ